jgi:hypothetical protein
MMLRVLPIVIGRRTDDTIAFYVEVGSPTPLEVPRTLAGGWLLLVYLRSQAAGGLQLGRPRGARTRGHDRLAALIGPRRTYDADVCASCVCMPPTETSSALLVRRFCDARRGRRQNT